MRYFVRLLVALALLSSPAWAQNTKRVYLTSGTTWAVPQDWNSQSNIVEIIGAGGIAEIVGATDRGGGGGAYAKQANIVLQPGSTTSVHFGGASDGGIADSVWFKSSTTVRAQSGWSGDGGFCFGCGGQVSGSIGMVRYAGGDGGLGSGGGTGSAGGGGAAGPNGVGGNGGFDGPGGQGGNGFGGVGGLTGGGAGGHGTEYDPTHGSGGGGGGDSVSQRMGPGGRYGGGTAVVGGVSVGGLIVITYSPRHRVSTSVF